MFLHGDYTCAHVCTGLQVYAHVCECVCLIILVSDPEVLDQEASALSSMPTLKAGSAATYERRGSQFCNRFQEQGNEEDLSRNL